MQRQGCHVAPAGSRFEADNNYRHRPQVNDQHKRKEQFQSHAGHGPIKIPIPKSRGVQHQPVDQRRKPGRPYESTILHG